jgi:hypothetical protein
MDPSQLHILTETGIICETQTKIILESRYNNLSAGRQTYQLTLHHENFYQISRLPDKSSNKNKAYARRRKYLVYLNNTLDWIIKPDSIELDKYFEPQSLFQIIADDICCTIFPRYLCGYVICLENSSTLTLRKWTTCIQNCRQTIFQYQPIDTLSPNNDSAPSSNVSKHQINQNAQQQSHRLVQLSKCNPLTTNSLDWLVVVTNKPQHLPEYLQSRLWTKRLPSSLLYLDYIIRNYDNMTRMVFLLDRIPIIRKYDGGNETVELEYFLSGTNANKLTSTVDTRINIAETRIRYKSRNTVSNIPEWSKWYNYQRNTLDSSTQLTQELFWSHIIQQQPNENIIDFPSNNTYYLPSHSLCRFSKEWYLALFDRLTNFKRYSMTHLDRIWYPFLA